jgi:molecular chaperone DnaJ
VAIKRDYYEVLGVERSVGADELKRTFRKLALEYHPDRNPDKPDAADRFKEISEAYAILSDPEKRRRYDLFGHGGVGADDSGFENFGFGDIFDSFFGGFGARPNARQSNRGDDLRYDLTLEFEEAFKGLQREIDVPRLVRCETCTGSGAQEGTRAEVCTTCGGAGQVRRQAQSIFGMVVNIVPCPECGGEGRVLRSPCPDCKGQGRVREHRKVSVRIPAGVEDGTQFRLTGEGEAGLRGGPTGDLYVVVRVKPHAFLIRRGKDVIHTLGINIVQAALGDTLEIPTLDGPVAFHMPEGTQFGQQFRLAGKGMPDMRTGRRGDQIIVARIVVPKSLNEEQKGLLRKVGGLTGKPEKLSKGFFEKLRDAINID